MGKQRSKADIPVNVSAYSLRDVNETLVENRLRDSGFKNVPRSAVQSIVARGGIASKDRKTGEAINIPVSSLPTQKTYETIRGDVESASELFFQGLTDIPVSVSAGIQQMLAGTDKQKLDAIRKWQDDNTNQLSFAAKKMLENEEMSIEKFMFTAGNTVGQIVSSMATAAAGTAIGAAAGTAVGGPVGTVGGAVGGFLGGMAVNMPFMYNSLLNSAEDAGIDNVSDRVAYAYGTGIGLAALESVPLAKIAGWTAKSVAPSLTKSVLNKMTTKYGAKSANELIERIGADKFNKEVAVGVYKAARNGIADRVIGKAGGIGLGMGAETIQEVTEFYMEKLAQATYDSTRGQGKQAGKGAFGVEFTQEDFFGKKARNEAFWNGVFGTVGGGFAGTVQAVSSPLYKTGVYDTIDTFVKRGKTVDEAVAALNGIIDRRIGEGELAQDIADTAKSAIQNVAQSYNKIGGKFQEPEFRYVVYERVSKKDDLVKELGALESKKAEIQGIIAQNQGDADIYTVDMMEIDKLIDQKQRQLDFTSTWLKDYTQKYYDNKKAKNNTQGQFIDDSINDFIVRTDSFDKKKQTPYEFAKEANDAYNAGMKDIDLQYDSQVKSMEITSLNENVNQDFDEIDTIKTKVRTNPSSSENPEFADVILATDEDGNIAVRRESIIDGQSKVDYIPIANTPQYEPVVARAKSYFENRDSFEGIASKLVLGQELTADEAELYEDFADNIDGFKGEMERAANFNANMALTKMFAKPIKEALQGMAPAIQRYQERIAEIDETLARDENIPASNQDLNSTKTNEKLSANEIAKLNQNKQALLAEIEKYNQELQRVTEMNPDDSPLEELNSKELALYQTRMAEVDILFNEMVEKFLTNKASNLDDFYGTYGQYGFLRNMEESAKSIAAQKRLFRDSYNPEIANTISKTIEKAKILEAKMQENRAGIEAAKQKQEKAKAAAEQIKLEKQKAKEAKKLLDEANAKLDKEKKKKQTKKGEPKKEDTPQEQEVQEEATGTVATLKGTNEKLVKVSSQESKNKENGALDNIESTTKALDLEGKSADELYDAYDKLSTTKDRYVRSLANLIDDIQERNERKSILNAVLSDVVSIIDSILKQDSYLIDDADARQSKQIVNKYLGEVSKEEAVNDFKDAFFGNPGTWIADSLKMRESVRVYIENGGTFKDMLKTVQKEFENDGFSEEDAAGVIEIRLSSLYDKDFSERQKKISEAYHKAKKDGNNPELVDAVESLLGGQSNSDSNTQATETVAELEQVVKEAGDIIIEAANNIEQIRGGLTNEQQLPTDSTENEGGVQSVQTPTTPISGTSETTLQENVTQGESTPKGEGTTTMATDATEPIMPSGSDDTASTQGGSTQTQLPNVSGDVRLKTINDVTGEDIKQLLNGKPANHILNSDGTFSMPIETEKLGDDLSTSFFLARITPKPTKGKDSPSKAQWGLVHKTTGVVLDKGTKSVLKKKIDTDKKTAPRDNPNASKDLSLSEYIKKKIDRGNRELKERIVELENAKLPQGQQEEETQSQPEQQAKPAEKTQEEKVDDALGKLNDKKFDELPEGENNLPSFDDIAVDDVEGLISQKQELLKKNLSPEDRELIDGQISQLYVELDNLNTQNGEIVTDTKPSPSPLKAYNKGIDNPGVPISLKLDQAANVDTLKKLLGKDADKYFNEKTANVVISDLKSSTGGNVSFVFYGDLKGVTTSIGANKKLFASRKDQLEPKKISMNADEFASTLKANDSALENLSNLKKLGIYKEGPVDAGVKESPVENARVDAVTIKADTTINILYEEDGVPLSKRLNAGKKDFDMWDDRDDLIVVSSRKFKAKSITAITNATGKVLYQRGATAQTQEQVTPAQQEVQSTQQDNPIFIDIEGKVHEGARLVIPAGKVSLIPNSDGVTVEYKSKYGTITKSVDSSWNKIILLNDNSIYGIFKPDNEFGLDISVNESDIVSITDNYTGIRYNMDGTTVMPQLKNPVTIPSGANILLTYYNNKGQEKQLRTTLDKDLTLSDDKRGPFMLGNRVMFSEEVISVEANTKGKGASNGAKTYYERGFTPVQPVQQQTQPVQQVQPVQPTQPVQQEIKQPIIEPPISELNRLLPQSAGSNGKFIAIGKLKLSSLTRGELESILVSNGLTLPNGIEVVTPEIVESIIQQNNDRVVVEVIADTVTDEDVDVISKEESIEKSEVASRIKEEVEKAISNGGKVSKGIKGRLRDIVTKISKFLLGGGMLVSLAFVNPGNLRNSITKKITDFTVNKENTTGSARFDVSTFSVTGFDGCAAYVTNQIKYGVGKEIFDIIKPYGNAWTINGHLVRSGNAKWIFNPFDNYVKKDNLTKGEITNEIKSILAPLQKTLSPSDFNEGDIVNLFYEGSNFTEEAYNTGVDSYTSHIGIVKIDNSGRLVIEHNIHGIIKSDKISDVLSGNISTPSGGVMLVSGVARIDFKKLGLSSPEESRLANEIKGVLPDSKSPYDNNIQNQLLEIKRNGSMTFDSGSQKFFNRFAAGIERIFPGVSIGVLSEQDWIDSGLSPSSRGAFNRKTGQVMLRESMYDGSTFVHEVGHAIMKIIGDVDTNLYNSMLDAVEGTKYEAYVRDNYPNLTTREEILSEAMGYAIQDKGVKMQSRPMAAFRDMMTKAFNAIKKFMGYRTNKDIGDMTLDDFTSEVAGIMFGIKDADIFLDEFDLTQNAELNNYFETEGNTDESSIQYQYFKFQANQQQVAKGIMRGSEYATFAERVSSGESTMQETIDTLKSIVDSPILESQMASALTTGSGKDKFDGYSFIKANLNDFATDYYNIVTNTDAKNLTPLQNSDIVELGNTMLETYADQHRRSHIEVVQDGKQVQAFVDPAKEASNVNKNVRSFFDAARAKGIMTKYTAKFLTGSMFSNLSNMDTVAQMLSGDNGIMKGIQDLRVHMNKVAARVHNGMRKAIYDATEELTQIARNRGRVSKLKEGSFKPLEEEVNVSFHNNFTGDAELGNSDLTLGQLAYIYLARQTQVDSDFQRRNAGLLKSIANLQKEIDKAKRVGNSKRVSLLTSEKDAKQLELKNLKRDLDASDIIYDPTVKDGSHLSKYVISNNKRTNRGISFELENEQKVTILLTRDQMKVIDDMFENGGKYEEEMKVLRRFWSSDAVKNVFTEANEVKYRIEGGRAQEVFGTYIPIRKDTADSLSETSVEPNVKNMRFVLERTGLAGRIVGLDMFSIMNEYMEQNTEYIANAEYRDSLRTYRNSLTADDSSKNRLVSGADMEVVDAINTTLKGIDDMVRSIDSGLKSRRDANRELDKAGIPHRIYNLILSNFSKAVFSFNLGNLFKQSAGYLAGLGQGIVSDGYIYREMGYIGKIIPASMKTYITNDGKIFGKDFNGFFKVKAIEREMEYLEKHEYHFADILRRIQDESAYTGNIELDSLDFVLRKKGKLGDVYRAANKTIFKGLSAMRMNDAAVIIAFVRAARAEVTDMVRDGRLVDAQNNPVTDVESPDALRLISEKASELIYRTNNMYMENDKTPLQRSNNILHKSIGLFSSQPQKISNLFAQRFMSAAQANFTDEIKNKTMRSTMIWAMLAGAALQSSITIMYGILRNGYDEEREYELDFFYEFIRNFTGMFPSLSVEVLNGLLSALDNAPWTGDIASNPVFSLLENAIKATAALKESMDEDKPEFIRDRKYQEGVRQGADALAKIFGAPTVAVNFIVKQALLEDKK